MSDHSIVGPVDSAARCPGFVTDLVMRCGHEDRSALVSLMHLLYAPVRARVAAALPDAVADELVGQAFLHIWRRAASYDPVSSGDVVTWLLTEAASVTHRAAPVCVAS